MALDLFGNVPEQQDIALVQGERLQAQPAAFAQGRRNIGRCGLVRLHGSHQMDIEQRAAQLGQAVVEIAAHAMRTGHAASRRRDPVHRLHHQIAVAHDDGLIDPFREFERVDVGRLRVVLFAQSVELVDTDQCMGNTAVIGDENGFY